MQIFQNISILYIENDLEYRKHYSTVMRENGITVLEIDNTDNATSIWKIKSI